MVESFLGLNELTTTKIGENQAALLQNLYLVNEGREFMRRKGTTPLAPAGDSHAFDGLHFARINGVDTLIGCHNGNAENWLSGGSIFTGGTGVFTSGTPVGGAFLPTLVNQAIYMGDGTKQNVRYNGTRFDQAMCDKPASSCIANAAGVGTAFNGIYGYRVTFLSADGQDSQCSDVSGNDIAVATNNAQVNLTNIALAPAGQGCTGRHIWRSLASGLVPIAPGIQRVIGPWYLVGTINDNTTTTFTDTVADTTILQSLASYVTLDTTITRFPPCQILVTHQLRLCGILCSAAEGDLHTLYVSDQQKPWYCPQVVLLNQVDDPTIGIRINLPEQPTGLLPFGNVLIVAFQRQMWRLSGDNPNNWSFDKWLDVGCAAHRTMKVYRHAMIWLGPDGIYMTSPAVAGFSTGIYTTEKISRALDPVLSGIPAADFSKAHAFLYNDRYYICFPSRAFYYDLRFQIWGELTTWIWDHSAVSENSATTKELIYATIHNSGRVWQLETGTSDNGVGILVQWQSKDKDMGQFGREKRLHRVICDFLVQVGDTGSATVFLYIDGGTLIQTFTQDLTQTLSGGALVSRLDSRCVENARGNYFALGVQFNGITSDFRLLSAGGHYTVAT